MELIINNFDIRNSLKNFCISKGGNNLIPDIYFTTYYNCKHYALIMEDTSPACGLNNIVHWYVPYINVQNNQIVKFIEGNNTTSENGKKWIGPCAPSNHQIHNYNFILYALDKKYEPTENELEIIDSSQYEYYLQYYNIKILCKVEKNFTICIDNNFYKQFGIDVSKCNDN